jgi:hypothetical protein
MVARPEMIDPHKFGVTVGLNREMEKNVFPTESELPVWLDICLDEQRGKQP